MYFVIDVDEVIDQARNSTPDGDDAVNMDDLVIQELLERSFTATDIATTNPPSTSVGEPSNRIAPIKMTSEYTPLTSLVYCRL